ncbi:hypothetical protein GGR52DRAFT_277888 [Hypoxylon sp. FL1284]|nr:hypothetical protein GGR52DRAFT_277888 [Hypoxylon sp. FL1284]
MSNNHNSSPWPNRDETIEQDKTAPTIEGLELDVSHGMSLMLQWGEYAKIERRMPLEVKLTTGFAHRPCKVCVNRETVLRGRVMLYLEQCTKIEAWAIWMWLSMRSSAQVDFWNHQVGNFGLPDLDPRQKSEYRSLMASGWKARTGVAWEDVDDVELGEYSVPFAPHDEIFTRLSQWNTLARIHDRPNPVAMFQPPLLDTDNITLEDTPSEAATHDKDMPAPPATTRAKPADSALPCEADGNSNEHHNDGGSDQPATQVNSATEADMCQASGSSGSDEGLQEQQSFDVHRCRFGYYHIVGLDLSQLAGLPLGIGLVEGPPIDLNRGEPFNPSGTAEADDQRKRTEVVIKNKRAKKPKGKGKRKREPLEIFSDSSLYTDSDSADSADGADGAD